MTELYISSKGDPEVGLFGVTGIIDIDTNVELTDDDMSEIKQFFAELFDIEKSEIQTYNEYKAELEAEAEMEANSLKVYLEGLSKEELIKMAFEEISGKKMGE